MSPAAVLLGPAGSVPACGTVPSNTALRRLASLAVTVLAAVALAACGSSGTPSAHQSGAGATHRTSTSGTGDGGTTSSPSTSTSTSTTTATTTTAPAAASQDITFSPFTAQGGVAPGLQVTQEVSGHCTSPGVAGSASYRCMAEPGDVSYDPCFAPPSAATGPLLCVPEPTVTDVIRFSVGALPHASTTVPQTRVWAMRLQNGEVCVLVNAQWDGRGPFACPAPGAAAAVADCRAPTKTAQTWSTECQAKENASSPFTVMPVVNVWT
jgi:hypothetical protein